MKKQNNNLLISTFDHQILSYINQFCRIKSPLFLSPFPPICPIYQHKMLNNKHLPKNLILTSTIEPPSLTLTPINILSIESMITPNIEHDIIINTMQVYSQSKYKNLSQPQRSLCINQPFNFHPAKRA